MSRGLSANMVTEVTADALLPIIFVKVELDSGDILFWNGFGEIVYNSDTYLGAGNFLGVSPITESEDVVANGVTVSLNGLNSSVVSAALTEEYQGRPITIFFGALNQADLTLISTPVVLFKGLLDVMQIDDQAETATISVKCESELISLKRPKIRRYTAKDQQLDYPSDLFFDQVPSLQDAEVTWGRT